MHKARAFFFVCAGLLCLALAYHLGARSAGAQSGGGVECAAVDGSALYAVINRYVYHRDPGAGDWQIRLYASEPIPGASRVMACGAYHVILEDGSLYVWDGVGGGSGSWRLEQQFPTGATPAQSISIGQLKAKYATPTGK
jgi:hypothetical protein